MLIYEWFLSCNFARFGIILGMDWLKRFAARVNCEKLEVRVGDVDGRKVLIKSKREEGVFVSYPYSLVIPQEDLSSALIASEYVDVFDEVKGLPLHREI